MNRDVVVRYQTTRHQLGPGDRLTFGPADLALLEAPGTPSLAAAPPSPLRR